VRVLRVRKLFLRGFTSALPRRYYACAVVDHAARASFDSLFADAMCRFVAARK
jgi:hypothetical protein